MVDAHTYRSVQCKMGSIISALAALAPRILLNGVYRLALAALVLRLVCIGHYRLDARYARAGRKYP